MYLREYLKQFEDKKVRIYVDMDGVIADYNVGVPKDYDKKRPLLDSINKLKEISELPNVELYILSTSRLNEGIKEKNEWLDEYAPFFKKENRIIISRENNRYYSSKELKCGYMRQLKKDKDLAIVIIDDDPTILRALRVQDQSLFLLKDTVLVD
jgi:5'(3')-deoxyribonucleotidase